MKTIRRTKLSEHNDRLYVELRDYEIQGQSKVRVLYGEEYMDLTLSQLKKGKIVNTQKSQFPPYAYYKMIEYLWKPEIEKKEEKIDMNMDVRQRLAEEFRKKYA